MRRDDLLLPFKKSQNYWYLFPRAFWPYKEGREGILGFHKFLNILDSHQKTERNWTRDSEMEVLILLEEFGALPRWEEQEDYHAHFRNRINLAKKLGLLNPEKNHPYEFTEIGLAYLKSNSKDWSNIFEHQLIKYQFYNPSHVRQYEEFSLFPFMLTVSIAMETQYISIDEFILRLFIAKKHDEKYNIIEWINNWREFNKKETLTTEYTKNQNISFSARMIMLAFALSPAFDFSDNKLIIKDKERARLILSKCWPNLQLNKYETVNDWINSYGKFNRTFWPLVLPDENKRKRNYKSYIHREEGDAHKTIKRFAIENANEVFGRGVAFFREEYLFESSDRANLIFSAPKNNYFAVEVEVDVGKDDIVGVLQAVKYKYMFAVQEKQKNSHIHGVLIANSIHKNIKDLCNKYDISYFELSTKESTIKKFS